MPYYGVHGILKIEQIKNKKERANIRKQSTGKKYIVQIVTYSIGWRAHSHANATSPHRRNAKIQLKRSSNSGRCSG